MLEILQNFLTRPRRIPSRRRYEGAAAGRRWNGLIVGAAPLADALAARKSVGDRATHYVQNNGFAAKAAAEVVSAFVGSGLSAQSQHPTPAIRDDLEKRFRRWSKCADYSGRTTRDGVIAEAVNCWITRGEAFIHFRLAAGELRLQGGQFGLGRTLQDRLREKLGHRLRMLRAEARSKTR